MSKKLTYALNLCLALLLFGLTPIMANEINLDDETQISGKVVDVTGEPLAGVNITVKGTIVGTPTNGLGEFSLKVKQDPPLVLQASFIGYQSQEIEINDNVVSNLEIVLIEQTYLGQDIVVSASRVEESVLEAPVSIEQMDVLAIKTTASDEYYKSIANLKGVDVTTSSINFQIINSRGFNSTGNTRMVQLIDGMDTQAPALNFPIGNLNGPSELDVETIEFIPGAASALYGPNAFSGVLLINSKDPFRYQGLSVSVKSGVNHLGGNPVLGEPANPRPMFTTSIRYAKAFNNKFAFKANFSYMEADDWRGKNYTDKNTTQQGALNHNPAYDGVHMYGDDGGINIKLLATNPDIINALAGATGLPAQFVAPYVGSLPNQAVHMTGYNEVDLIDYNAKNMKASGSLHYRITDKIEASYAASYGFGTSIYTGAQRYSLKNFNIGQHKVELKGDNFKLFGYATLEDSGDSYIADFVGYYINGIAHDPLGTSPGRGNEVWFGTYATNFAGGIMQAVMQATGGDPTYNPAIVSAIMSNPGIVSQLHWASRSAADAGRFKVGSPEFKAAFDEALSARIPDGAKFDDQSSFYHVEGQYDFKNEIKFMDLLAGASFKQFQLRSHGTIFDDKGGVNINEWGAFLQGAKSLFNDQMKLTGSIRYDKSENFTGQFSPRISTVIKVAENQNIRASYQTGFRNPSTQAQYIDLDVITARLLGGLPYFNEKYKVTESTYTLESIERFSTRLLAGDPGAAAALEAYDSYSPVKPEQVQAIEVGYKGLIGNRLFVDLAYYYNIFNDFITQHRVRQIQDSNGNILPLTPATAPALLSGNSTNTYQIYTNNPETVTAHGAIIGMDYSLPYGYMIGFNYNFNKLLDGLSGAYDNDFNTPEHKLNVMLSNRKLTDRFGFNITYRYQSEFDWLSSFVDETVPAVSTVDAQLSYTIPEYSTTLKFGGSNILNDQYVLSGGAPSVGAIYYVSLTFDQLFR